MNGEIVIRREVYGFLVFNAIENLLDKGLVYEPDEELPLHWEIKIKELLEHRRSKT